jgi:hypothetical protein
MSGLTPTSPVTVDFAATLPATGTVINGETDIVISLAFSGRVTVPLDCVGEYVLRDEVSNKAAAVVPCYEAIVQGNSAILPFRTGKVMIGDGYVSPLQVTAGDYYLDVTADVVEDYGGKRVFGSSSLGAWKITHGGTYGDAGYVAETSRPVLAGSVPRDQEILLPGAPLELYFSESIVVPWTTCAKSCLDTDGMVKANAKCSTPSCFGCGAHLRTKNCAGVTLPTPPKPGPGVQIYDCGDDSACGETSADVLIASIDLHNNQTIGTNGSKVTVPLEDWLLVPGRRYKVVVPADSLIDLRSNYVVEGVTEFLYSTDPFDSRQAIAAASTVGVDKVEYDLQVAADTAPGTYRICFCNSAADLSPRRAETGVSSYYLLPPGMGTPVRFTGATVVGQRTLEEHLCDPKCLQGCSGDDCFCEDLDSNMNRDLYCLSPDLCATACHASAGCVGVSVKGERCALLSDLTSVTAAFGWSSYRKGPGAPCTDPHDFGIDAGAIVVTQAVDVGVDFVITPGEAAVLEVSGAGLMSTPPFSATSHRISIIDSFGRCGVSPALFIPDPMVLGGATEEALWSPALWDRDSTSRGYSRVERTICPTTNLPLDRTVPLEGWIRPLSAHQCYGKCLAQSCTGDSCFCEGALSGYDTTDSNALCVDAALCEKLCESLEECSAYEMHRHLPRCFLNDKSCFAFPPNASSDYDLYLKRRPLDAEHGDFQTPPRELLSPLDPGTASHDKLLRFPLTVTTGGSYKVCFCESDGTPCSAPQDFAVELGALHSSGISCLLHDKTKSKTCVAMPGGLRCYAGEVPDTSPPHFDVEVK